MVVSRFRLVGIRSLSTFGHKIFFYGGIVLFILGKCLGVGLLGHRVGMIHFIGNCKLFTKVLYHFYTPMSNYENSCCSTSLLTLVIVSLSFNNLSECKIVLICVSLITNDAIYQCLLTLCISFGNVEVFSLFLLCFLKKLMYELIFYIIRI